MKKTYQRLLAVALAAMLLLSLVPLVRAAGETGEHRPYLCGYPDGTIRPDAPLSREALAQVLARLMDEDALAALEDCKGSFLDVSPQRWSWHAVSVMAHLGFLLADEDGYFHPEEGVTGQELALTLSRIAASEDGQAAFGTLVAGWKEKSITFSGGFGWVMGLRDGVFAPEEPLTRADFAAIINGLLQRTPQSLEALLIGMPLFSDNTDTEQWYFLPLQEAAVWHSYENAAAGERWTALG